MGFGAGGVHHSEHVDDRHRAWIPVDGRLAAVLAGHLVVSAWDSMCLAERYGRPGQLSTPNRPSPYAAGVWRLSRPAASVAVHAQLRIGSSRAPRTARF